MLKEYVRDKRSPIPEKEITSKIMSLIKGKNTRPELTLRHNLWKVGVRGYRTHWKKVPGKPDICFVGKKIAIFVNGCYWHRCPYCKLSLPKTHSNYWMDKFKKNVERDRRYKKELAKSNWKYIIVWECQINKRIDSVISRIKRKLEN